MGATGELVRRWQALYNDGTPDAYGSDSFLQLYAEELDWAESPTMLTPEGRSGNLRTLRESVAMGRQTFRNRHQAIDEVIEEGDRAAWTGHWHATIGIEGLPAPKGTRIQIAMAMILEVRGGLIVRQRDFLTAPTIVE